MNIVKPATLSVTLLAVAMLAGCSTEKPSDPQPVAPTTTNSATGGVSLRGLITSPERMKPQAVCWDGGAPGVGAFFTGVGAGNIKVTLTPDGKAPIAQIEKAWLSAGIPLPQEGHVEITFQSYSVQPGIIHVRLEGIDKTHLEFDVNYTGHECDR